MQGALIAGQGTRNHILQLRPNAVKSERERERECWVHRAKIWSLGKGAALDESRNQVLTQQARNHGSENGSKSGSPESEAAQRLMKCGLQPSRHKTTGGQTVSITAAHSYDESAASQALNSL